MKTMWFEKDDEIVRINDFTYEWLNHDEIVGQGVIKDREKFIAAVLKLGFVEIS